jgi:hypothetical protein
MAKVFNLTDPQLNDRPSARSACSVAAPAGVEEVAVGAVADAAGDDTESAAVELL